jgi:hypothetical protein
MASRSPRQGDGEAVEGRGAEEAGESGLRIRRRGFLGAGLAGAGAALLPAAGAASPRSRSSAPSQDAAARPAASAGTPIPHLPLQASFPNLPAIPLDVPGMLDSLPRLTIRTQQVIQAKQGLTNKYTLGGATRPGYAFLFGGAGRRAAADDRSALAKSMQADPRGFSADLAKALRNRTQPAGASDGAGTRRGPSLERPEQFSIAWTTLPEIYQSALPSLPAWAASLTDADAATEQFWPTIAEHGFGYNLIIPQKVKGAAVQTLRRMFGSVWTGELQGVAAAGNLYAIDMSIFQSLQPHVAVGAPRFTPSTITLLTRNPKTKALTPVAVLVSGYKGRGRQVYSRRNSTDGAWLYALQAAKASVSVFGVWLGHVYHWHIVTCAMQMTMFNTFPASHPIYQLLAPQSQFAMAFDGILLARWSLIAPPTSIATGGEFLGLANDYATGRSYFDDDPKVTLRKLGLVQKDFTRNIPWDQYPVVQRLLTIWDMVTDYVNAFARTTYRSDAAVAGDSALQAWIASSSSKDQGNIRGLPRVNSRAALERVLTSLVYRISVHGISRMNSTANPALTFVPNFPHCLQRTDIPKPRARIDTRTLLTYLPNVETIGEALNFYFTFVFSTPYQAFIPLGGVDTELFFPGGTRDPRNKALINLRNLLASFIDSYQPDTPQRFQWPRNIET